MTQTSPHNLDIFIKGESINLCIPTSKFVETSCWYSWLNNRQITRFIPKRGIFPNSIKSQQEWFDENNSTRLILIITDNRTSQPVGVINLSSIDFIDRKCDIALALDNTQESSQLLIPFWSLESAALVTEHAFKIMGMRKIYAHQHELLYKWGQRMELLGYKLEGFDEGGFVKGDEISDFLSLTCQYKDFNHLFKLREGRLWDSQHKMINRIKKLPKKSFFNVLKSFWERERKNYYQDLYKL